MNITKTKLMKIINETLNESMGEMFQIGNPGAAIQAIELWSLIADIKPAGSETGDIDGDPFVRVWFDTENEMNEFVNFLIGEGFKEWPSPGTWLKGQYAIQTAPLGEDGQKYVTLKI